MVGWTPEPVDNLEEINGRINTIETILNNILERLHAMQVVGELRNAKEDQKLAEACKKKGDN